MKKRNLRHVPEGVVTDFNSGTDLKKARGNKEIAFRSVPISPEKTDLLQENAVPIIVVFNEKLADVDVQLGKE